MTKFNGFLPGKQPTFAVYTQFISELLPLIDHVVELKVTLYAMWAIQQREGTFRYLLRRDFTVNAAFMAGIGGEAALDDGLARACARETLLSTEVELGESPERLYFINTALGRTALEQVRLGLWQPGHEGLVEILPERPNIYRLYEDHFGQLTPMIADMLKDAEKDFPLNWIIEAMRIAVAKNARNWRFVQGILDRWQREGKGNAVDQRPDERDGKRYISGEYADFLEW
ncbi:MAG: DnaD domain protein [Chloroflexi bacterium]|uniref:DnaD domain-containing protein n=1 Tax=Candidatus Flexifilum breve TaxID=3140694 RepID=UPI0031348E9F|nr:DnaD domain protein [Chloroflexota bacterium]